MSQFVADQYFMQLIKSPQYEDGILPKSVHVIEDYHLTTVSHQKILLDMYYRDEKPACDRAAVIFLHGGGFWNGDKKQFQTQAAYLALQYNMFAISLNYRLNSEGIFPAALQDVKCAIRWLRSVKSKYKINPARIVLLGGSPGGNLAAMAATTQGIKEYEGDGGYHEYSSTVNLAVVLNGILDFFDFIKTAPSEKENVKKYLGGSIEDIPEIYTMASPLMRVNKLTAPMILLHGDNDVVIPWQKSLQMHHKLTENGVLSEIEIFKGKGHAWFNLVPDAIDVLQPVERFLHKYQYL
jgi:acetyl esterase/lipase